MKIEKISIDNVLSYKNKIEIDFNKDLNIFIGPNGGGKSNLLNIIICMLKKYCFKTFELQKNSQENIYSPKYSFYEKSMHYNKKDNFFLLPNKKNDSNKSEIIIEILIEPVEVENIEEIFSKKQEIIEFIDREINSYHSMEPNENNKEMIKDIFNINIENIKNIVEKEKRVKLKLVREKNEWNLEKDEQQDIFIYMKYFSVILDILAIKKIKHNIINNFMFFEAYRNNSQETTIVSLTNSNNHQPYANNQHFNNMRNLNNTIGSKSTYITQITKFYAEKRREYVEIEDGTNKFNNDEQYVKLREYLKLFDYDIELTCLDPLDNIYQFYIVKNGQNIEIDLISNGEREIINFIFGMFSENIKDGIIIIDEPELHLHPTWQKKLIDILKKQASEKNVQIFFATHSSSFIRYDILNNIYRVYIDDEKSSNFETVKYDVDSKREMKKALEIINSTNNEKIFFCRNIVLVEGITDEIIFRKIFNELIKDNSVYDMDIVTIGGKGNYSKYKEILEKLKISCFFITDKDYICKSKEMEKLLIIDLEKVDKVLMDSGSYDGKSIISSIENVINNNEKEDIVQLQSLIDYIKFRMRKLKEELTEEEQNRIKEYILKEEESNIYILEDGAIESYIGVGYSDKAVSIQKAVYLTNDGFDEWKKTDEYKKLEEKVNKIKGKFTI